MEPVQLCARKNEHKVLDEIIDKAVLDVRVLLGTRLLGCDRAQRSYLYNLVDLGLPFDVTRPPKLLIVRGGIQLRWPDRHVIIAQLYTDGTRWMMYTALPGNPITATPIHLPTQMDVLRAELFAKKGRAAL